MIEKAKQKDTNWLERLMNQRAFWPVLALTLIIIVNRLIGAEFFTIRSVEGRFVGSLIDILNRASPVILLSIGMTLVIATKGIDLSVGAIIAISGATAAVLVTTTNIPAIGAIFI